MQRLVVKVEVVTVKVGVAKVRVGVVKVKVVEVKEAAVGKAEEVAMEAVMKVYKSTLSNGEMSLGPS